MNFNFFKKYRQHRCRKTKKREQIMPAIDNLKKSVNDLGVRIDAAANAFTELKQKIADLSAAVAAAQNVDPDIQAAADSIDQLIGKLNVAIPEQTTTPPAQ